MYHVHANQQHATYVVLNNPEYSFKDVLCNIYTYQAMRLEWLWFIEKF